MNLFARAWKGEASLAAAFWLIYFLFGLILAIIVALIVRMVSPDFFVNPNANKVVAAICFPYTLYAIICVWRCAKNSNAFWRIVARIIVALALIFGIFNLWDVARLNMSHEAPTNETAPVRSETSAQNG